MPSYGNEAMSASQGRLGGPLGAVWKRRGHACWAVGNASWAVKDRGSSDLGQSRPGSVRPRRILQDPAGSCAQAQ
eukprot:8090722-Pyramimonas_sp.AAC.1